MRDAEATHTLIHPELDVNSWANNDPDVEAGRPARCPPCGGSARRADGRLRLHGHGRRRRDFWGLLDPDGRPGFGELLVRRYRCTDCKAVLTVLPRGLWSAVRYTLATIAMALVLWALRGTTAARVRQRTCPLPRVGDSEPHRWRSLGRWARRADELFGLPTATATTSRALARHVAHLIIARGPPDVPQLRRAFDGAQVR